MLEDLRGRGRLRATVEAREWLTALDKHPVTGSGWVMGGVHKRKTNADFKKRYDELGRFLAGGRSEV